MRRGDITGGTGGVVRQTVTTLSARVAALEQSAGMPVGAAPPAVEMRNTGATIQWRTTGGAWADLLSVDEIKGQPGDPGEPGAPADAARLAAVEAAIGALQSTLTAVLTGPRVSIGRLRLPLIAATGKVTNLPVPLDPALPDTAYQAIPLVIGGPLGLDLTGLTPKVTGRTKTHVTCEVGSTLGLPVAAGVSLVVIALSNA